MCNLTGIPQYLWIVSGLVFDAIGFVLLGWDLIHLQRDMKKRVDENISTIEEFSEKYDEIQGWSNDIRKSGRWINESEYSSRHAEDEVSFNAHIMQDRLNDLANCVEDLAKHLFDFVDLFRKNAKRDRQAANRSLRWSIIGLLLIISGFGLQIVGALCM